MSDPRAYWIDFPEGAPPFEIATITGLPGDRRPSLIVAAGWEPVALMASHESPRWTNTEPPASCHIVHPCYRCPGDLCKCGSRLGVLWDQAAEPVWAWPVSKPAQLVIFPNINLEDPDFLYAFERVSAPAKEPHDPTPPPGRSRPLRDSPPPPAVLPDPRSRAHPEGGPEVGSLTERYLDLCDRLTEIEDAVRRARIQAESAIKLADAENPKTRDAATDLLTVARSELNTFLVNLTAR